MAEGLFQDQHELAALCQKHAIRRLSLFGSVLKGTARPDSDVDLLVEFVPEKHRDCLVWRRLKQNCRFFWVDAGSIYAPRLISADISVTRWWLRRQPNLRPEDHAIPLLRKMIEG